MTKLLYAGSFSAPPVKVYHYGGAKYAFIDAEGKNCWTDPNYRVLVFGLNDATTILDAHGYDLDTITLEITKRKTTKPKGDK